MLLTTHLYVDRGEQEGARSRERAFVQICLASLQLRRAATHETEVAKERARPWIGLTRDIAHNPRVRRTATAMRSELRGGRGATDGGS
jgi:hypothetical protein